MRARAILLMLVTQLAAQTFDTTSQAYRLQGEYQGTVGGKACGMQVCAWTTSEFWLTILPGGLPGSGWGSNPTDYTTIKCALQGAGLTCSGSGWSLAIDANGTAVSGTGPGGTADLKKVYRVSPTMGLKPPAGGIMLFDGTQASADANWWVPRVEEGWLREGARTREVFTTFTLHLELCLAFKPGVDCYDRDNSGVMMLRDVYEVQVLDNFGMMPDWTVCSISPSTRFASIFNLRAPDINAAFPPVRWQTLDIMLTAPQFSGSVQTRKGRITVWVNGVIVHNDWEITGWVPDNPGGGELGLQNHANPVRYRNIWAVKDRRIPPATVGVAPIRPGSRISLAGPAARGAMLYSIDGRRIMRGSATERRGARGVVVGGSGVMPAVR